jgi:outer membrane protein OmpA-like peptidoglycan-associated protein
MRWWLPVALLLCAGATPAVAQDGFRIRLTPEEGDAPTEYEGPDGEKIQVDEEEKPDDDGKGGKGKAEAPKKKAAKKRAAEEKARKDRERAAKRKAARKKKTEEKKAAKAGKKKAGKKKAGKKKAGKKKAGEKKAGEKKAGEKKAGEKKAGEKKAGPEVAEDSKPKVPDGRLQGTGVGPEKRTKWGVVEVLTPQEAAERSRTMRGDVLPLPDRLYFHHDSLQPAGRSIQVLQEVADMLQASPEIELVFIEGHTDLTGTVTYNQKLSEARASAIREVLVQMGVAPERLVAYGLGELQPVVRSPDTRMLQANRRVVFRLVQADRAALGRKRSATEWGQAAVVGLWGEARWIPSSQSGPAPVDDGTGSPTGDGADGAGAAPDVSGAAPDDDADSAPAPAPDGPASEPESPPAEGAPAAPPAPAPEASATTLPEGAIAALGGFYPGPIRPQPGEEGGGGVRIDLAGGDAEAEPEPAPPGSGVRVDLEGEDEASEDESSGDVSNKGNSNGAESTSDDSTGVRIDLSEEPGPPASEADASSESEGATGVRVDLSGDDAAPPTEAPTEPVPKDAEPAAPAGDGVRIDLSGDGAESPPEQRDTAAEAGTPTPAAGTTDAPKGADPAADGDTAAEAETTTAADAKTAEDGAEAASAAPLPPAEWKFIEYKQQLAEGVDIRTEGNGTVLLRMPDLTRVLLLPGTQVRLGRVYFDNSASKSYVAVRLRAGRIRVMANPINYGAFNGIFSYTGGAFETEIATFDLEADAAGNGRIVVYEGRGRLAHGGSKSVEIGADETAVLGSGEPNPAAMLARPDVTGPLKGRFPEPPGLEWKPVQGAGAYEVQVSSDVAFYQLFALGNAQTLENRFLPSGLGQGILYYWRVRGLAVDGSPGSWSKIHTFRVDPAAPPPETNARLR